MISRYHDIAWERDRLLDLYARAEGEEKIRILARLVVLDEETEGEHEQTAKIEG